MTGKRNDRRDVADALVEFAQGLGEHETVEDVLGDMADLCTRLLPVDGVGVLLLDQGDLSVATTNSDVGERAERLEVDLDEGPCTDCTRSGHRVLVPDLEQARDRFPRFVPKALEAGVGGIHALPMSGTGGVIGSLNVVTRSPLELTAEHIGTAQMLADVAVAYIMAVQMQQQSTELAAQLQQALLSRVAIEQAKGVLAERHDETMQEAFERLRRHARSNNQQVRDVAEDVVGKRLRL
jgi:GAF domain-containing protein